MISSLSVRGRRIRGGYKAAQLGLHVACIDKRDTLGGTCLNVGCIPSKALLSASGKYLEASKKFADIGIEVSGLGKFDANAVKKDSVVSELTKGIEFLFKKNKVEWLSGEAFIRSNTEVEVTFNSGKKTRIVADKIMIAVGSEPVCLPNVAFDESK